MSAYADDALQSVVLVEGKVNVKANSNEDFVLLPNQRFKLSDGISGIDEVNAYDYISWKDGVLQFRGETMKDIILPQAIKNILPAIGNEFVSIIKESSILYTIGIYELTYQANKLASTNFRYLETLTISALIYFVLTFTASRLLGMLERRMRRGDR